MQLNSQRRKKLTTSIDRDLLKRIKRFAITSECSVNAILERLIADLLEQSVDIEENSQKQLSSGYDIPRFSEKYPTVSVVLSSDVYRQAKKLATALHANPPELLEQLLELILPLYVDTLPVEPTEGKALDCWLDLCAEALRMAVINQKLAKAFEELEEVDHQPDDTGHETRINNSKTLEKSLNS